MRNYTIEEMRKSFEYGKTLKPFDCFEDFINSLDKQLDTPIQKFISYMEKYEVKILPDLLKETNNISPAKFVQVVINEIKKNERLLNAFIQNPHSMFASILAGAEIGLVPSDMLGEFYLIPKVVNNKLIITPLIGYKGLVKILLRGNNIDRIEANVVYKDDSFKAVYGTSPSLVHKPKATNRTAENITHVYCVAFFKSGNSQFQVLSKEEILAIKNMSKSNSDLYFNDEKNPNRWMEKKCCLIQLSKLLDKDYYGTKAIELDGKLEGGAILTLDDSNKIKIIEVKRPKNVLDLLPN